MHCTGAAGTIKLCETGRQKHIFLGRGLQSGFQCCVPLVYVPTEGESCPWPGREGEREEGEYRPLFSNCVSMSPLTVSVPQHFTMEAIVCLGEKAWVFCFNHFWKSYV